MSESRQDRLDEALAKLPRAVAPERDLWTDIRKRIDEEAKSSQRRAQVFSPRWYQMAAGVLLVAASSLITFLLMREPADQTLVVENEPVRPALVAMPASFGVQQLGAEYTSARATLDAAFQVRLASLPVGARKKVERNLNDIRLAAREISETLAQHPTDPLLQELLLSTYQSELQLLADVTNMAPAPATRVNL
jgi:hypothetical protein